MNRKVSRVTALSLVLAMMVSLTPYAAGATVADQISLEAEGSTITVHADETQLPDHLDPFDGTGDMTFTIARDFEQDVWIPLGNNTSSNYTYYYMTVDNAENYPDLSMNFVAYRLKEDDSLGMQGGYAENPGVVRGGSSASSYSCGALLKIFAQEAEDTEYDIDVTFHNLNDDTTSTKTIHVMVTGQGMNLAYTLAAPADDGSVTVTLTNNGADISSMNIEVEDASAADAYLPTLIHNYPLDANSSMTFVVAPTAELDVETTVNLVVKGNGDTKKIPVTLTAPEPESTSGEELAKNISAFGQLTAALPEITADADGDKISFTMESSKDDVEDISGTVTINTTTLTEEELEDLAQYGYVDDDVLEGTDGSVMWIDDTSSVVSGGKLTIKMYQLFLQGEAVVALASDDADPQADDPAAAILKEFDLEIDLSGYGADTVLGDYSIAIEDDGDLKTLNNAPLPPKTKKRLIAYRQMELLLQKVRESGDTDLMDAFADAFNQGLPDEAQRDFGEILDSFTDYLDTAMEQAGLERDRIVSPFVPKKDTTPSAKPDVGAEDTEDYSRIDIIEDGRQCTNRGEISSSFHAQDTLDSSRARIANSADAKGVRVFYTGRITSEDNYINFEPIQYDLYIQTADGEKQSIGTSVNTGLSELNIIELDPIMIPLGEKITFTRDYDINPGTHFVNTDNRFTIVYPADASVAVDASNVQLAVPDFDVYKKNIFLLDGDGNYVEEGIVGQNTLHVSVSNRGARGGYYQLQITGSKSGTLVDDVAAGTYRYLPAFETEVLELPVMLSATTDTITVKVTDCSQRTRETDFSNNSASYTISARERQVPTIHSIKPADGSTLHTLYTSLVASLGDYLDVTGVTFTLQNADGTDTLYTKTIDKSGVPTYTTENVTLQEGATYTLTVDVSYLTGGMCNATTKTLTKTTTFTAPTNGTWATIRLPEGTTLGTAPEYKIYSISTYNGNTNYYTYTDKICEIVEEDGSYALNVLGDGSALNGKLLTIYDPTGYALYAGMIGEKGTAIDMTDRRTMMLDGATFQYNTVSVSGPNRSYTYTVAVSADQKSVSLPNIPVYVRGSLLIDGVYYSMSKQLTEADYTDKTYTFSVNGDNSSITKLTFTVPENTEYEVYYVYKNYEAAAYYSYRSFTTDVSGTTLTALMNTENMTGCEPFLFVYTSDYWTNQDQISAAYVIPMEEYKAGMDLTELTTHTLTLTAEDPSLLEIQNVEVMGHWGDYPRLFTWSTSMQCTPGTYTVAVSYTYDGLAYSLNKTVDLTTADQTIDLSENLDKMAQLALSWDAVLGNIDLTLYDGEGKSYYFYTYGDETSGTFRVPAGTYSGVVNCSWREDGSYRYCNFTLSEMQLTTTKATSLHLGAQWTGKVEIRNSTEENTYTANQYVNMTLSDVKDAQGNQIDTSSNRTGYVIFTSTEGTTVVRTCQLPYSYNGYSSFSVKLPGEPGTYTIRLSLENPLQGDHTITATAGVGGTISPRGTVAVMDGEDVTFTITPNESYVVSSVLVDGTDVGARNSYTFTNVTTDHTIEATFEAVATPPVEDPQVYSIVATAGEGGTISPEGTVNVEEGGDVSFTITPDNGYVIQSVKVDGKDIGARYSFTFADVKANHTIAVTFQRGNTVYGFESFYGFTGNVVKNWSVTVGDVAHGVIHVSKTPAAKGDLVKLTAIAEEGYALDTIRALDAKGNEITLRKWTDDTYTFTMPNKEVTIEASFALIAVEETTVETVVNPFTDVTETDWFYKDVLFAYENGLFRGVSDTAFAPNDIMSRAMFVTVLSRTETLLNGTMIQGNANSFLDIPEGQWYTDAVLWAAEKQITSGYGDGTFGKDDNVTREQACTFIVRYLTACGVDLSAYAENALTFTDAEAISSWAKDSVALAQAMGIIKGRDDGRFDPAANMTRAECAAVFHRLMEFMQQK